MTNRPEKGSKAPLVTIPVSDEESVNLGAPEGKAHVVYFYPRDNTPGCTTESIDFSSLQSEFEALGVQIIGVSKDSLKSHANFKTKKELTVILASAHLIRWNNRRIVEKSESEGPCSSGA